MTKKEKSNIPFEEFCKKLHVNQNEFTDLQSHVLGTNDVYGGIDSMFLDMEFDFYFSNIGYSQKDLKDILYKIDCLKTSIRTTAMSDWRFYISLLDLIEFKVNKGNSLTQDILDFLNKLWVVYK